MYAVVYRRTYYRAENMFKVYQKKLQENQSDSEKNLFWCHFVDFELCKRKGIFKALVKIYDAAFLCKKAQWRKIKVGSHDSNLISYEIVIPF